jgi:galactokinase
MTSDRILDQLERAGLVPDDAASRSRLFDQTIAAHVAMTGRRPDRAWFVPGRIEIFGKHTDYAGGQSLVAAVPRGFAVVASRRDDGRVRLTDAHWKETVEVDPADRARVFTGWTNYVAVVARRLAMNFPGVALGADIAIRSDVPRAAGVSSSSALVVAVASVLADLAGLEDQPEWRAAIRSKLDLAGYLGAVENGLAFPGLAGAGGVGTHGGSEDHTAILASQPGRVAAFAYVPVRRLADAPMPEAWRFIIMTSGVHADKAGDAREPRGVDAGRRARVTARRRGSAVRSGARRTRWILGVRRR